MPPENIIFRMRF